MAFWAQAKARTEFTAPVDKGMECGSELFRMLASQHLLIVEGA